MDRVRIEQIKAEKALLLSKLNGGKDSNDELQEWALRVGELMELIDEKTDRWLELSEIISES